MEIRNAEVVRAMVKAQAALNALQSAQAKEKEDQEGVKKVAKMWAGSRGKAMKRWDAALAALGEAEVIARRQIVDDVSSIRKGRIRRILIAFGRTKMPMQAAPS